MVQKTVGLHYQIKTFNLLNTWPYNMKMAKTTTLLNKKSKKTKFDKITYFSCSFRQYSHTKRSSSSPHPAQASWAQRLQPQHFIHPSRSFEHEYSSLQ